jgi:hypothetical protein
MRGYRFHISAACFCGIAWLLGSAASAQLVVGNDQSAATNTMWMVDVSNGAAQPLTTGTNAISWGMAANDPGQTLWWNNGGALRRSSYSNPLAPVLVGNMTVGGNAANVTGMAFNTANSTLYGYRSITAPGFYSIDQTTAVMTLVAATPTGTDFGGFDYDPIGNTFYGLNDGTGLSGRGLYRIDNLLSGTPTYTLLTAYPGGDTDIDGLAVGGGRAYWVNDVGTQQILVYNLTTNAFENPLPSPFGTGGIFSAGAWAPGLIPEPATCLLLAPLAALALVRRRR